MSNYTRTYVYFPLFLKFNMRWHAIYFSVSCFFYLKYFLEIVPCQDMHKWPLSVLLLHIFHNMDTLKFVTVL